VKKENTTLELMVQSCDELILEIATKTRLSRMGEDNHEDDSKDKDYDDENDGGDATAPPAVTPPADATPAAAALQLAVEEEEEDLEMLILE
jgi:hypothetical protein